MTSITTFPPLYKHKGIEKYRWSIEIQQDENDRVFITTYHGLETGKWVKHSKEIAEGKCGRTLLEQAELDAQRKWINKKEKELYMTINENENENANVQSLIQVRPMLAQTADLKKTRGYQMPFPLMAQRKYDGIRCIAHRDAQTGQIVLESRKGTSFTGFPELTTELERILTNTNSIYLDGELFTDKIDFESISGLVRSHTKSTLVKTKKATEKQKQAIKDDEENTAKKGLIEYHIYDMIDTENLKQPFSQRWERLYGLVDWNSLKKCKYVESYVLNTPAEIKPMHDHFVSEGFEGIMLRDINAPYEINKRSKYLQKYKEFVDEEFNIVGFHEGSGNEKGAVVWDCITQSGQPFAVRPRGTFEMRQALYKNAASYIGKQLTVIFQEYSTDGIPRFPVGKGIRENKI